jgi:hypothetical protein
MNAANEKGKYELLTNNCTNAKERMLDRAGLNPSFGK